MRPETFKDLMKLSHGFEPARILLSAVELDLFSHLSEKMTARQLAARLSLQEVPLTLVLNAMVAMGLLDKEGDDYVNGPLVGKTLVSGQGYRGHIFRHIGHCWPAWGNLSDRLRGREVEEESWSPARDEEQTRDFILGMENVTRELAPLVVGRLGLGSPLTLLDVGGGPGTYAEAFLKEYPSLREVCVFDLPKAAAVGRQNLKSRGVETSVRWLEGDFHDTSFGQGFDVVWISQVLHSLDMSGCRMLIDKAFEALVPGGELILHEFLIEDHRTGPLQAAIFAVHMLVMTGVGRTYAGGELSVWLDEAGFVDVRVQQVSDDTSVVRGRKPVS
ncbi:methyltransferase [Desulfuromonas sp. AOP6]|uniref:methyltransferase n=1 Tax=Desulfuromonas sp. AOP6 TaxID=1566351 RepID=UPI00126BA21B|nr:methyltransferase [Desulfuromonas sp. AOP6]BCA79234.1 SAM-dependent methyltransferase [Desulfuromonas sp. AOP6]